MKLPGDFDQGGTEAVTDSARILNNLGQVKHLRIQVPLFSLIKVNRVVMV